MAYKVIILYRLYMPYYFLGTFTEYPYSMEDLLEFRRFDCSAAYDDVHPYFTAALEKLQTLYPGRRVVEYDHLTLGIDSDFLDSETGVDVYELGLVDGEVPAMRRVADGTVVTFRI